MKKLTRFLFSTLIAALLAFAALAEESYKVVVHSSVPLTSISRGDLSMLLSKKITTYDKWGSTQKVVPFDLSADSPARAAFSKDVHRKALAAVKSYWQQQIFSGRGTPPAELANDGEVVAAVSRNAGGIGYVSSGASLPDGVKQVKVTD